MGLRSLLYALSADPITIEEISEQQLETHPDLSWSPEQTDMAKQRANRLCSMGVVERHDNKYELTSEGQQFVDEAVETWADPEWTSAGLDDEFTASTYQTVTHARVVDPGFRATVLSRYGTICPVSGVDHAGLLNIAHILPLCKTHHAAFDRGLFTIDGDYRLRLNPSFETKSDVLRRTIVDQAGERVSIKSSLAKKTVRQMTDSGFRLFNSLSSTRQAHSADRRNERRVHVLSGRRGSDLNSDYFS